MEYADHRWWAARSGDAHGRLWEAWKHLRSKDSVRQQQHLHWRRMYGNRPFHGLNPAHFTRANATGARLKFNVIKAVVNRIHARTTQQRPRPLPISTGGNYSMRTRARLLGRYLDAQFRITGVHALGSHIAKDAMIVDSGAAKVWEDGEQVRIERVLTHELFVDPLEAYYGAPRTLYHQRWIARDVLAALYPKARATIQAANRDPQPMTELVYAADLPRDSSADQVLVVEAWHLPSGPGAGDGSHAIAVDSGIVASEPWEHDYFPFVFLRWDEPQMGFWCPGIPDEIEGIQLQINTYLQMQQSSHELYGKAFLIGDGVKRAAQESFTNKIGTWIDSGGGPFDIRTFQTMSPEIYAAMQDLYNKSFELIGASNIAGSTVPAGLPESGVGLRTLNDMSNVTHLPFAQRYERFFVDVAHQVIDRARDIAKRKGGKYAVPAARDRHTIETLRWADVDMERDAYTIQVMPTSSLPAEPAGRLAQVETMARAGLLDARQARLMLDFPDLDSETVLDRAATDAIDRAVEMMLDDGVIMTPSPYMDLQLTLKRVQAHYLVAECDGVPEERLELLRGYLDGVHEIMRQAQVEQMKVSMAAGENNAPAPAGPGAPPAPGPSGQPPTAVTA